MAFSRTFSQWARATFQSPLKPFKSASGYISNIIVGCSIVSVLSTTVSIISEHNTAKKTIKNKSRNGCNTFEYGSKYDTVLLPFDMECKGAMHDYHAEKNKKFISSAKVVLKAVHDMGFNSPVVVKLGQGWDWDGKNSLSCKTFFDDNWKPSLLFSVGEDLLNQNDDKIIYALTGHQTAHVLRKHSLVADNMGSATFLLSGFMLGSIRYLDKHPLIWFLSSVCVNRFIFREPLERKLELDADTISAIKLGTADDLIAFLEKGKQDCSSTLTSPGFFHRIYNLKEVKAQKDYPSQSLSQSLDKPKL
jgi:hypothetical protein